MRRISSSLSRQVSSRQRADRLRMLSCSAVVFSGSSFNCCRDGSDLLRPWRPLAGEGEGTKPALSLPQSLTLAVSSSCRSSSRLEGFNEEFTQVRWPRNWMGNGGVVGRVEEEVQREVTPEVLEDPDLLPDAVLVD